MVFKKKEKWKHSLSAKKFLTKQEAQADYDDRTDRTDLTDDLDADLVAEAIECYNRLSPVEEMWKLAD